MKLKYFNIIKYKNQYNLQNFIFKHFTFKINKIKTF